MQFKLIYLLVILTFIFVANALLSDETNSIANSNLAQGAVVSTNITSKVAPVVVSEEFEGLHRESLDEVKEATIELTSAIKKEANFNWDIHWDKGIRYQLASKNPLWSIFFLGNKEKEVKLDGKVGFKLDLDGMNYDESYSLPSSDVGGYIRRARLYTAGYFFLGVPTFYKVEAETADNNIYLREAFLQ